MFPLLVFKWLVDNFLLNLIGCYISIKSIFAYVFFNPDHSLSHSHISHLHNNNNHYQNMQSRMHSTDNDPDQVEGLIFPLTIGLLMGVFFPVRKIFVFREKLQNHYKIQCKSK